MDQILSVSFHDLSDDFAELSFLFSDTLAKIRTARREITKKKQWIEQSDAILTRLLAREGEYASSQKEAVELSEKALLGKTEKDLKQLIEKKQLLFALYRIELLQTASLITSSDWQSPTFLHSTRSLAGRQTGEIKGTINDYKRDSHNDEKSYEEAFVKEYVHDFFSFAIFSYLVNSGMAALTTILTFLQMEGIKDVPVMLGKSAYFENRELIHAVFGKNVHEIDENRTEEVLKQIVTLKPRVIFLDTLCNNATVTVPDTEKILSFLAKTVKTDTTVVLDNTGLPLSNQPLSLHLARNRNLELIVFESLNKYHQFGADRITAGIIWAYGKRVGRLFYAREHSGTNILDTSVYALPRPSKKYLAKRLSRFERNTKLLSMRLQGYITDHPKSPFETIYYPSLPHHASAGFLKTSFHGSYFCISFKKKYQKISVYKRFVEAVIAEAKKEKVSLVSGTSFGMNTSRIYLTALRSDIIEPFIRFSVGTESRFEIERVASVLLKVMEVMER